MYKALMIAAATILMSANAALAGPFGIEMGTRLKDLQVQQVIGVSGLVKEALVTVPQPDPEFELYMVSVSETAGVCNILAVGVTYKDDHDGQKVMAAFDRLSRALAETYGMPMDSQNELKAGAVWKDDADFAASVLHEERDVYMMWLGSRKPGAENILNIMLAVQASSESETQLVLKYDFKNAPKACR
ncbi:hypothetical protein ABAC460_00860 [Asticcacaulis sp. AC460]|uniref:hypothetical protein n=1 Tax=Asticcacaulis sp. AC460 TaxID=1282360 RepID=UPI0003C3FC79|nr:hypothetical protein [Asticcacaulis sp. AC460]ESQ93283.1 hypothetical protein ABAC460_00860 [Asticcacaulis sp. AC460]